MKLIGMIGGVSWESTAQYYRLINEAVRKRLGGLNSARILIHSLNYEEIVSSERRDDWKTVAADLSKAAGDLERAGASFILLGCNTLHKVAPAIESAVRIPFLHIADAAASALVEAGAKKVGLLGTQFTMEEGFYANRLSEKHGLIVVTPELENRREIDNIIYQELCVGRFLDESRRKLSTMMKSLARSGANAILLGCTELGMLVKPEDSPVPMFDTTVLHAERAVAQSLS